MLEGVGRIREWVRGDVRGCVRGDGRGCLRKVLEVLGV